VTEEMSAVSRQMKRIATETKPSLQTPKLGELLQDTKPIIEPGGELPPDRNSSNGAAH
jgi:hypothetical protein